MTRAVRTVSGVDETWKALREALTADGPAILPRAALEAVVPQGAAAVPVAAAAPVPLTVDKRICLIIETSGTSGQPKRVALRADALLASAAATASVLGSQGQWLLALPPHYMAGINVLVRSIAAGIAPEVIDSGPFRVDNFVRATNRLDSPTTFTSLVPAQLVRLLATGDGIRALQRFERVLVGGQATPPGVAAEALAHGIGLTRTYGSSETSGGCVYDGQPIGQTEVRIRDGQIEIAGPTLAEGYLGDPERTDRNFFIDAGTRWYRTGDAGEYDDGLLTVTGRLDDVIISGGVKVSLGAVEGVIRALPGLENSVVFREHHDLWGEVPVVVSTEPAALAAVRAAVTERLGREAAPARIVVVDTIPFLASGKPDVQTLRQTYGQNPLTGQ
jgi:O-succinylbenzoic acid--CoA ligase